MRVYLDNAASTPLDPTVFEVMRPYFIELQGNPSSIHHHGRKLRAEIERSRKDIATMLGAAPAEIFFTSGGTEADNIAIKCAVEGLGIKHIITTKLEHHAVLHPVEKLEKAGAVSVTWLKVDDKGNPDLQQLEDTLKRSPRSLVSLMHANNEIGTLICLDEVAEICAEYDAIFHSDTVQAVSNIKYNLSASKVHFITASAHKFYGPKGIGFLYIKSGLQIPPLICGGSQERNMRAGTENVPAIVGMAHALAKCYGSLEEKRAYLFELKSYMKQALEATFPGVKFNGETSLDKAIPTVLNVAFPIENEESMLLFNLDINEISASGGSACTSGSVQGSHVLLGLGHDIKRVANSIRFSFGMQNTKEEIDFVIEKLRTFVK